MSKKALDTRDKDYQHYYLRSRKTGHPYGVVAITPGEEPGTVHRGISLCSQDDDWDKVQGFRKAVSRMRSAKFGRQSAEPVDAGHYLRLTPVTVMEFMLTDGERLRDDAQGSRVFKSAFNAPVTEFEQPILDNIIRRTQPEAEVGA